MESITQSFELPSRLIAALEKLPAAGLRPIHAAPQTPSQAGRDAILWYLGIRSAAMTRDLSRLTKRQLEVLTLTAQGYSTKEIAERLGINVKTVETYRTQFMNTFHFKGVADAVRFAIRAGLMPPCGPEPRR